MVRFATRVAAILHTLQARIDEGVIGPVSHIRIALVEVPRMLDEIIRATISHEPDMVIVNDVIRREEDLVAYARRRRIDVVIFTANNESFADDKIMHTLHANPRLALLSIDSPHDQGTLHHLVPAHCAIGRLAQSSLTAAIRAGAKLQER